MKRGAFTVIVGTIVLLLNSVSAAPPVPRSVHYNGTSAEVQSYTYRPLMNTNVAMTVEAWVYREDASRCETILSHDHRSSFWFGFCPRLRFYRSGGVFADATQDVPSNQWTHVAASYDGTRVRFYINGVAAGNVLLSNSGVGPNNSMHIGGVPEVNNYYFRGNLDEVRLWNVARTQSQIQSNMFVQLINSSSNAIPELTVSFNLGGGTEPYRGWSSTVALSPSRIRGFGILPGNLVIPRSPSVNFNGIPDLNLEFAGAEQIVLRYNDGANAPDGVVYLAYRDVGTNRYLYFGTSNLRPPPSGSWENSSLTVHVDPNGSRDATRQVGDYYISTTTGGGSGSGFIVQSPFFQIYPQGASNWQYFLNFCAGEFAPPCQEIRIHASDFGSFSNNIGLFFTHGPNTNATDYAEWPGNGQLLSPATYAEARFGGNADANVGSVSVSGTVINSLTGGGISNQVVRLYSGDSSLTGILVAQTTTSASGAYSFSSVPTIADQRIALTLQAETGNSYLEPQWGPSGTTTPVGTNNNLEVVYPVCASCTLRSINFRVLPPPGAMVLNSFSPTSGVRTVTVRTTPPRVHAGDVVRIAGSNIHSQINVFFSRCTVFPPDFCVEGSEIFRVTLKTNDPARLWVDVVVPELPANESYRLVIQDNLIGHPGWTEWKTASGGQFFVREQIYPKLWGFEWANDGNGPSHEDFEAAYGDNIFTFIPVPPFKVRDPYYFAFWFPLYFALGDASKDGNCHGIAGVSRMFERGTLHVADFDTASSCGPSGVRFPNGFEGRFVATPDGVEYQPCKPAAWTGFDFFEAYRPRNLWAVIRQNMMAQFSEEGIQNILNQTTFDRGFPVAVLDRVRSNPAGYVLCFQPGGAVKGHCVTPYAVQDNLRLDTNNLLATTSVNAANFSIIRLYDNNWPNTERHMEINRSAGTFRYLMGFNDDGPVIWSGSSLYTVPMSFFTSGRHAPGPWNLAMPDRLLRLIFAAGADAQHTNNAGDVWGWNASGNFTNNYREAKSFFPFALGNYSNRFINTGYAFLPATNPPTGTRINVRSSNFIFQAAMDFTAAQFIADEATPGQAGARILISNSTMSGFSLNAGPVRPRGSAMLAQPNAGGGSTVYILIGLSLPASGGIDVIATEVIDQNGARSGKKGAMLVNRGSSNMTYSLRVEGVDGGSGLISSYLYGPFSTVPGAAHRMTFPEWPQAQQVFSETDFGADGSFEQSTFVAADRILYVSRNGNEVVLKWRSSAVSDVIESTDSLVQPKWDAVNGTPALDGEWRTLKLPAIGAASFYRVRP